MASVDESSLCPPLPDEFVSALDVFLDSRGVAHDGARSRFDLVRDGPSTIILSFRERLDVAFRIHLPLFSGRSYKAGRHLSFSYVDRTVPIDLTIIDALCDLCLRHEDVLLEALTSWQHSSQPQRS